MQGEAVAGYGVFFSCDHNSNRRGAAEGLQSAKRAEIAALVIKHLPEAKISFPDDVALYPNLQKSDGSRLAHDIKYQFPDIEARVLDTINEARRDHGMTSVT